MHVTGKPIAVAHGERRPGDPPILVADSTLASKVLGWLPKYPHIHTQIEHAWRWQLSQRIFNNS
jgi:UDP-glucose 4-epimerase